MNSESNSTPLHQNGKPINGKVNFWPRFAICDELPFFRTSAAMISRSLRRSRKLGFRFIGMAQGARVFPEANDDPLLHAMTSCCNSVILRHRDPSDAEFFGKLLSLPTRSATRVKYEHVEDQQIQVGSRIEITVTRAIAEAYSDSEGESGSEGQQQGEGTDTNWSDAENAQASHTDSDNESESAGTSESESEQQSQQLSVVGSMYAKASNIAAAQGTAHSNNSAKAVGHGQSDAVSRGLSRSQGGSRSRNCGWNQDSSWRRSRNRSGSTAVSYAEQIVPVLAWRKIVRVELMSYSEQDQEWASHLAKLLTGEAFFYAAGEPIVKAYINRSPDFLLVTPETAARLHRQLLEEMFAAPFYQFGDVILRQREVTRELFLADLRQYAIEGRLPLRKCFAAPDVANPSSGTDGAPQTPPSTTAGGIVTGNVQLILPDEKLRNAPWTI
jgi:hypothetical protein